MSFSLLVDFFKTELEPLSDKLYIGDIFDADAIKEGTLPFKPQSYQIPGVLIYPEKCSASPNHTTGTHIQQTLYALSTILVVSSLQQIHNSRGSLLMEADNYNHHINQCLVGEKPHHHFTPLSFLSSTMLEHQNGCLFWRQNYSTTSFISLSPPSSA